MKENGEIFFFLNVALSWVLNPNLKGAVFVLFFFLFPLKYLKILKGTKILFCITVQHHADSKSEGLSVSLAGRFIDDDDDDD